MPNYKQVETLLQQRKPFRHDHSMHAVIDDVWYKVFSYRTLIATFNHETGEWWLNPTRYSVTTSKQQNIIRRVIAWDSGVPAIPSGVPFP